MGCHGNVKIARLDKLKEIDRAKYILEGKNTITKIKNSMQGFK
jgi:hypothetical protein